MGDQQQEQKVDRKTRQEQEDPKEYPKYLYGPNNTYRIVRDPDEEASASENGFVESAEDVKEPEQKPRPNQDLPKQPQPHQEPQQLQGPPTQKQMDRIQQEQRPRNK